jgi:Mn2+/Fe2+ NRAMP family transporter
MTAESHTDPYTVRDGDAHPPPKNFWERIKYLGPSLIVSGSVVGSGELILTAGLGAAVGFALLWWMLISCWSKSIVQAEISRYIIVSGDTYPRAMNRIPGRIGKLSFPVWMMLLALIPNIMTLGGVMGGAGQALAILVPSVDANWATAGVGFAVIIILNIGAYKGLERVMLLLVMTFTVTTIICSIAMQFTEFKLTTADILTGFAFEFRVEYVVLALGAYGITGVNSAEISGYTYWCIEKGYPSFLGSKRDGDDWEPHARGWMKVLQTDVWLTLIILTCATLPYYILGAGVLNKLGLEPKGNETLSVLSNMFTETLGPWALWLFGIGAFFILFSTVLSGIGAGARYIPDYAMEMGLLDRKALHVRYRFIRIYVTIVPIFSFLVYLWFKNPVILVIIGGLTAAVMMPIQSGGTLWLQANNMDSRIQPGKFAKVFLWIIFGFQLVMAGLVAWFIVIKPRLG